jgi:hypothetical protein
MGADMYVLFDDAVGATYTTEGGSYSLTVNGSPTRVNDGTWPEGLDGSQGYGWEFDGSSDYLSRSDDGAFDPSGDFSVLAVVRPDTVAAGEDCIAGKYETTGNEKGWKLCRSADDVVLTTSADGSADTTVTASTMLGVHRLSCIVATYDKSATTGTIYVDEQTAATNASMGASVNDSAADLEIGASDTGSTLWAGGIDYVAYYSEALSAATARKLCRQYRGLLSTIGNAVSVSSASPPAIPLAPPDSGTQPFLVDQPANTTQVGSPASGSGGIYAAAAIDNLVQRSSFETWGGAGDATGWTEATGGSGAVAEDTSAVAHGGSSAKLTCTAGADSWSLTSACLDVDPSKDYTVGLWGKKASGTTNLSITVKGWSNAACDADEESEYTSTPGDIASDWTKYPASSFSIASGDWEATTDYATVIISDDCSGGAGVQYIDAVHLHEDRTYRTDAYCGCDTDATCSCTDVIASIGNPMSINGTSQIDATVRSPVDGAETGARRVVYAAGTGGGDENAIDVTWMQDYLTCGQHQSGGDLAGGGVPAAGNADTDYDVTAYHVSSGSMGCCWDGSTCVGAEKTTRDDIASTLYVGADDTSGSDAWVTGLEFRRRLSRPATETGKVLLYSDQSSPGNFELEIACPAGKSLTVYWGDGSSDAWVCDGTRNAVTHTYTTAGQYPIAVVGDVYDITQIQCTETEAYGDIAVFSGLTSLTYLSLYATSVSGDISAVSGLTSLTALSLGATSVSGDISAVSGLTSLTVLSLTSTSVSGDISAVSGLTSLTTLSLHTNTGRNLTYTSGGSLPAWAGADIRISSIGLDSSEVDAWLNDFDDDLTGADGALNIAGDNAARTSASDAAKTAINADGWALTVNE